jgi:hypothetical protein
MAAALAVTPASGSVVSKVSACRIDVTGADGNDLTAYDADAYPTSPEIRYYITAELAGVEKGRSHVFAPNDGSHTWDNYIFPESGAWTLHLRKVADDTSAANLAVTVS